MAHMHPKSVSTVCNDSEICLRTRTASRMFLRGNRVRSPIPIAPASSPPATSTANYSTTQAMATVDREQCFPAAVNPLSRRRRVGFREAGSPGQVACRPRTSADPEGGEGSQTVALAPSSGRFFFLQSLQVHNGSSGHRRRGCSDRDHQALAPSQRRQASAAAHVRRMERAGPGVPRYRNAPPPRPGEKRPGAVAPRGPGGCPGEEALHGRCVCHVPGGRTAASPRLAPAATAPDHRPASGRRPPGPGGVEPGGGTMAAAAAARRALPGGGSPEVVEGGGEGKGGVAGCTMRGSCGRRGPPEEARDRGVEGLGRPATAEAILAGRHDGGLGPKVGRGGPAGSGGWRPTRACSSSSAPGC